MTSSFSAEYETTRKLKDFLSDEWPSTVSKSLSRKSCKFTTSNPSKFGPNAVQRASDLLMNAIKFFAFASIKKTPRNSQPHKVRVKDILRWKSFNNTVILEATAPLPMSIDTTFMEGSTSLSSSSTISDSSSTGWDSDFTDEELSFNYNKDGDCMKEMAILTQRQSALKENEQHSPVSILENAFRDSEESIRIFHHNLPMRHQENETCIEENVSASVEYEETNDFAVIEKARKLFCIFKSKNPESAGSECLLYDFFRQEFTRIENSNDLAFEAEIFGLAESWKSGEFNIEFNQYWEQKKACVRDIEKEMGWKMLEEKQDMVIDLELCIFYELIDELFVDFTRKIGIYSNSS